MNESTLTQLKVLVERAVRPVRASTSRKRKMREELLAHVSAVFEEEATRLGDEQAAAERTGQRFGNPAELTGQLQESVPRSDLIDSFVDWVWFRPGESALRRAIRHALILEALLFLLTVWPLYRALKSGLIEPLLTFGYLFLGAGYLAFSVSFLASWLQQALHGGAQRSWLKHALVFAACLVLPLLWFEQPWLSVLGESRQDLVSRALVLPVSLAVCSWVLAKIFVARHRYHEEWATLRID